MTENETKTCPYCGETILAIAKKCRYCGEWLDEPQPEAKKTKVCPVCGEEIEKRQKTSKSIAETGLRTSGDAITFELSSKYDEIEDTEEDDVDEEESLPLFVKIIFCIIAFVAALGISTIIMQALFSDSIVKPHSVALATAISYGVYSFLRKLYFTFHG